MQRTVTVTVETAGRDGWSLLAPTGIPTLYQMPAGFAVQGSLFTLSGETTSGQMAALILAAGSEPITLTYRFIDGGTAYPETLFRHRKNRFTRAAEPLVHEARRIADHWADGHAAIEEIVNDVARKFSYGHPAARFNDGAAEVPYLSCALTEGSCVDINTYLIAMLRAAGFEAGYVTGYFFPAEKQGTCEDMHCWVVTRHQGAVLEWDIAHHMKLGKSEICCGLNPKAGERVAVAHSMGLDFPELGIREMKLLAEPVWVDEDGKVEAAKIVIRLAAD